jgi:two-component system NarL family sensor kinase
MSSTFNRLFAGAIFICAACGDAAAERTRLSLQIIDDGDGFDPNAAERGLGNVGIHERVDAMGGTIDLTSTRGGGTCLSVLLDVGASGE